MLSQAFRSFIVRIGLSAVILCLGVMIGIQFTNLAEAAPVRSSVSQTEIFQSSPNAPHLEYHECVVARVHEWDGDRGPSVMIGCSNPAGAIEFFAQPLTDTKRAARILSIALTARVLNKPIGIDYDLDDTNVLGCSPGNCRNIYRMFLIQ